MASLEEDEDALLAAEDAIEIIEDDELAGGMHVEFDEGFSDESDFEDLDLPDASLAHFASHSATKRNPIYCIAAHPKTSAIAASGGQDDLAYIWATETGEEIVRLTGHTDSVVAVAFSSDGELVATGGMDGKVRLWRRVKPASVLNELDEWSRWEFLTNLEGPDEVTTLAWHPKGPVLAAGSRDGTVWMWKLPSGKTMSIFSGHSAAVQALAWVSPSEGKKLLSASEASELYLYDPNQPYSEPTTKFTGAADPRFAFESGITALAVNAAGTLAAVGGAQDAALKIVNLASGQLVAALAGGHKPLSSIEALHWLDLSPALGVWVSGASDGSVCAWEGTSGALRWKAEHPQPPQPEPEPPAESSDAAMEEADKAEAAAAALEDEERVAVSCIALFPSKAALVSSGADGSLRAWDTRSGALATEYIGHSRAIHALAITPDGQRVLSGGDNGIVRVHQAQQQPAP